MSENKRPLILVTNDDGITSIGIRLLTKWMSELGEVVVVAPNSPQSGMGHAITLNEPLKVYKSDIFGDIEAYECSGTPADCVKVGKNYIFKGERTPDLLVSGINHGSNTSVSVMYSGTMSAALEGAIEHFPAIGFSLCDYSEDAEMKHLEDYIKKIAKNALSHDFPKGVALNVNFPTIQEEEIKGIKICRQAMARWEEEFDERVDPYGRKYLWLTGKFVNPDKGEDTDTWAIKNNYVSIVPVTIDLTAHHVIPILNDEWTL